MVLVIVSGPSGVGKDRLIRVAQEKDPSIGIVTPYTTRPRRRTETEGYDYLFVTRDAFRLSISKGFFFDWDYTLGNYYGCRREEMMSAATEVRPVFMHALARMAIRIAGRLPGTRLVYMRPRNYDLLSSRLMERGYSADEIVERTAHWREEDEHSSLFDVIVDSAEALSQGDVSSIVDRIRKG